MAARRTPTSATGGFSRDFVTHEKHFAVRIGGPCRAAPRRPPKLIHLGDGLALGEVGNVYVAVWRGPVTAPRFEAQRSGLAEVSARNPHGIGLLCVIEPTAKAPTISSGAHPPR